MRKMTINRRIVLLVQLYLFMHLHDLFITKEEELTQVLHLLALCFFPLFILLSLLFSGSPLQNKRQLVLDELQQLQAV